MPSVKPTKPTSPATIVYELFHVKRGKQWMFRAWHKNGNILCGSVESYHNFADALQTVRTLKGDRSDAAIFVEGSYLEGRSDVPSFSEAQRG